MSGQPPPYSGDKGQEPPYSGAPQGYPQQGPPPGGYPPQGQYGPPQGGYPPHSQAQPGAYGQHTTVVIQSPAFGHFAEFPVQAVCPHCHATVTTSTVYETGTLTWVIAGILLLFGCWLGCCLIPFCVDQCKDVIHSCPQCHQVIGRHKRM
jgi:lipopolysaccharide-induced tumor necrosis factor-alpha factor